MGGMQESNTRWENYRRANSMRPQARENELREVFELLGPKPGERIWEAGTGNGYLTFPIAQAVSPGGMVVTSDVEPDNIAEVNLKNAERGLPIETCLLKNGDASLPKGSGSFDAVTSIATLHHYDDRSLGSGEAGRRRCLRAFWEALQPGGRLVVADVLYGTIAQAYFDRIDDPRYCAPRGHPHDFFTQEELLGVAHEVGFTDVSLKVLSVPWTFASPAEAQEFIHTIHNATCSPEESFRMAKEMLGFTGHEGNYQLGWELFFLTARKPL